MLCASYPWRNVSHYLIVPIGCVMLLQYFGPFSFVTRHSPSVLYVLRVIGICSSEVPIAHHESFILFSNAFYQQFAFNAHLMLSFVSIAFLCVVMNWTTTEHVAACFVGVWLRCDGVDGPQVSLPEAVQRQESGGVEPRRGPVEADSRKREGGDG